MEKDVDIEVIVRKVEKERGERKRKGVVEYELEIDRD